MDLLDPFSSQLHHVAFDRLKSHTSFPCPAAQSINIPLKFHCGFSLHVFLSEIVENISLKYIPQNFKCLNLNKIRNLLQTANPEKYT